MTINDIGRIPIGRVLHLTDDERFWMVVAESPRVDNTVLSRLKPPPAIARRLQAVGVTADFIHVAGA